MFSSFEASTFRGRGHRPPRGAPRGGRGGEHGRGRGSSRGGAPHEHSSIDGSNNIERAPPGKCRYYWSTGSCNRGFDCTFQHVAKPRSDAPPTQQDLAGGTTNQDEEVDFFSIEGLAINTGARVDEQHRLKPAEAHNYLRPFLREFYTFENGPRVEGFARIFASVNDRNKSWTSMDAQTFLDSIVHGNGLLRVGDALRYRPVCVDVGSDNRNLSFQRGYFPLLEFMSSDLILKTTMNQNVNALYTTVEQSFDELNTAVSSSIENMIQRKSWSDHSAFGSRRHNTLAGVIIFRALTMLFSQLLSRFKQFVRNHPEFQQLIANLVKWFNTWSTDILSPYPQFADPITSSDPNVRTLTIQELSKGVDRLQAIVDREFGIAESSRRTASKTGLSFIERMQARVAQLAQIYVGPGELRPEGPRHDNDFSDIRQIRIAPTHEELMAASDPGPYLPVALPDAPHHLPRGSIERHVDIQFRLYREELTSSIRTSIQVVHGDLETMWKPHRHRKPRSMTRLETVMARHGGAYRTDQIFFHLYTNIRFAPVTAERRSFSIGLLADAPDGPARDAGAKKRMEYWEHAKRLQHGSLVALLIVSPGYTRVHLGTLISMPADIAQSARPGPEDIAFRVEFFDAEVALMALRRERISRDASNFAVLVDNGVMYPSIAPFLKQLQNIEPRDVPFGDIIASANDLRNVAIMPPRYARAPRFKYRLQCLAKEGTRIQDLDVSNPAAVARARQELLEGSQLDPSQVFAIMDTFTRELSLIQGPPGTGKSFTGKEMLRVLFASSIKPIVLIAFTNHALDHMINSVLDADITSNIVRLGSQSKDERVSQYNLVKLEALAGRNGPTRAYGRALAAVKDLEGKMKDVMDAIQLPQLSSEKIMEFLHIWYPEMCNSFEFPPFWIASQLSMQQQDEEESGEWKTVANKKDKRRVADAERISGVYGFWKEALDIQFLYSAEREAATRRTASERSTGTPSTSPSSSVAEEHTTPLLEQSTSPVVDSGSVVRQAAEDGPDMDRYTAFFSALGFGDDRPPIPSSCRNIETLLSQDNVWGMSPQERQLLAGHLEAEIRDLAYKNNLDEFEKLRGRYEEACEELNDVKNEGRRMLLSNTDLIGCTTTGAAKLVSLLTMIKPKVLLVEEAGQVLESHIIAALVPSVEHLICIGDPQQLRPNLANYALSMDSQTGRELYKFDRSLMERLASSNWPMSQINVQRRMRPSISHFIRAILYPKLEDHEVVRQYPKVQGVGRDVVFFTHTNAENAEADSASKFNLFEAGIVKDLVLHFLKQEEYNGPGDISVLCAYLGQLQKVRAALRDLKIAVSVDERDEEQLIRRGEDLGVDGFEQVQVARHIRLGTVDTFQGEEAKIVIVSLVRNSGTFEEASSIGFLKSSNRINVALSRAKHGLFILGNASNLRQNPTWRTVLEEMEGNDQISHGIPIACPRHPHEQSIIMKPGQLAALSPEGGCLLPCEFRMPCGHVCPSVCHVDRDGHRRMKCDQPCLRVQCPRSHPCPKTCSENCGSCLFPIYNVALPCGHVMESVPCFQIENLSDVLCPVQITKKLPNCEHTALVACSEDTGRVSCDMQCGGTMQCCSRTCRSKCWQCQKVTLEASGSRSGPSISRLDRIYHESHPCERVLVCQHMCGVPCSKDHRCNTQCKKPCRQQCIHHKCPKPCSVPCPPCMEPCPWACVHDTCPVVCGSICSRLPCDEPCRNTLSCGHLCPSVCGEPCEIQKCIFCASDEDKATVVDWILQRPLNEIDPTTDDVADRIVTLACGHVFTVETLDGHCDMKSYYDVSDMGQYLSTKAPPIDFKTPPCCPTCRGPITALRYGRVTKRANLDILEQNVASAMSKSLDAISPELELLSAGIEGIVEAVKKIAPSPPELTAERFDSLERQRLDHIDKDTPLSPVMLSQAKMTSAHGFAPDEARAWIAAVRAVTKVYKKVYDVACTRGPHVNAYDAALSTLYRLELAAISKDPLRACKHPEPLAMGVVNEKVGQPPHKADTRFQAEAFFLSLEVRYFLAQAAQTRVATLATRSDDTIAQLHHRLWASFTQFLHESCLRDAHKALQLASKSSASRIAARATLHILRAQLEEFRFDIILERDMEQRAGPLSDVRRQEYLKRVDDRAREAADFLERAKNVYVRSRPVKTMEDIREERTWFNDNCGSKAEKYFEEFGNLRENILKGVVYQPLSMQEREDIVRAFNFGSQGHFYNCENGHTFVITECGGAMETATCPECRAPIGGSSHALLRSNTRAAEFEDIAGRAGAQGPAWRDPWAAF